MGTVKEQELSQQRREHVRNGNNMLLSPPPGNVVSPFQRIAYLFVIFSFVGYVFESAIFPLYYGYFRPFAGPLHGPWLTIYGFGALALIFMLGNLSQRKLLFANFDFKPMVIYFLTALIAAVIEYFTHWFLEYYFNFSKWDYSGEAFNLNGRIYLFGTLMFALLGTASLYFLVPLIDRFLAKLSKTQHQLLYLLVVGSFVLDCVFSFALLLL